MRLRYNLGESDGDDEAEEEETDDDLTTVDDDGNGADSLNPGHRSHAEQRLTRVRVWGELC